MSIPRHLEFELVPASELNEALKQVRELQNGAPVLASPARWGALTLTAKGAGTARFRPIPPDSARLPGGTYFAYWNGTPYKGFR
ncbi:hypothetical protein [Cupriavidus sp. AcVe19-1a]|uniref:hypothetical protein n=1 Tax=Cupriavidus sp. AcVe19-1a TaxID=2821359 RepID=UPI001AE20DE9|nr:hypothetical protein [Cupriavidus sp. AcVe19-1a]MBP0633612.1 hypothetical protein [Cupriavidus sp. AcVe19-1a]